MDMKKLLKLAFILLATQLNASVFTVSNDPDSPMIRNTLHLSSFSAALRKLCSIFPRLFHNSAPYGGPGLRGEISSL